MTGTLFSMLPAALLALLVCPSAARGRALPDLPGPAPQSRVAPDNARCEGCHVEIAAEWRASYHRRSYEDPAVQRSFAGEQVVFCRSCHAPEAPPRRPASGWAAAAGVACVTCHIGAEIDNTPRWLRSHREDHGGLRPASLGVGACLRCHEFQFPDGDLRPRAEWMQRTAQEHLASTDRDRGCVDCHMPRRGSDQHRSHLFLAGHDAGFLRRALRVEATREPGALRLLLSPQRVGHAMPSGDLFRRLLLTASVRLPDGGQSVLATLALERKFTWQRQRSGRFVKVEVADTRLRAARELRLPLPASTAHQPLLYRVVYQRVLAQHPGLLDEPILDGEIPLASGTLAPPPDGPAPGHVPTR